MASEAANRIEFIEARTGDPVSFSVAELGATVIKFSDLVDETILSHAAIANISTYTTRPSTSWVSFGLPFEDGSKLQITVGSEEAEMGSLERKRDLAIQVFGIDGEYGQRHEFKHEPEQLGVIRSDRYPATEEMKLLEANYKDDEYWRRQKDLAASMSLGEMVSIGDEQLSQMLANKELDALLGYNHLPVGLDEISSLEDLITTDFPTPKSE